MENLIAVLQQECVEYNGLLELSSRKTPIIVAGDLVNLEKITDEEQEWVGRIAHLEKKRTEVTADIADVLNKDVKTMKLRDLVEIEKAVAQRSANWQKQLEEMAEYQESLKCRSIVPPEEMRQISRLYRKMVKMIHPDLHPELEHDPRIRELWDRLQTAYRLNALDEMEEIAVLIHQVLADSDTAPVRSRI